MARGVVEEEGGGQAVVAVGDGVAVGAGEAGVAVVPEHGGAGVVAVAIQEEGEEALSRVVQL